MTDTAARVRAPELRGSGGWINTERPLRLDDLRGRVVLLDFWTFCCINCIHVIEELRPLEERFGDRLVVIGVHSPKFPHEGDHAAVERAVRRHRIEHPVLDDPEMETWQQYGVRAWPTLVVIDPRGYAVGMASGEGNGPAVGELIQRLLDEDPDRVVAGPAFTRPQPQSTSGLSFPGKVASDGGSRIAIADTGHDRVLVCGLDGGILSSFGGFAQPQGVRFDGDRLLVCDTVAGRLVAIPLSGGGPQTLADGISSPWDVVRDGDRLIVAEAGRHRLLSVPAGGGSLSVAAGTRAEGLRDGPATQAHLAQPSGVTRLAGGGIAFADSEVSALRVLRDAEVSTLVGEGLFEWGDDDGEHDRARLQHPLGVAGLPDGGIAIADTFNSRLRVWREDRLSTVSTGEPLDEPGGIDLLPDGRWLVADTNHHRVVIVDPGSGAVTEIAVGERRGEAISAAPGAPIRLELDLDTSGEAVDPSQGPPVRVTISAEPPALLGAGPRSWALEALPVGVELTAGIPGEGTLTIDVSAATCEGDVCRIHRRTEERDLRVG